MKKLMLVLATTGALLWSASWVSACDNCGCKGKVAAAATTETKATVVAPETTVKATVVATETAVKCVACPLAKADATKPAAKCTGDCKVGCCKGDASKCAAAATCPLKAAGAQAKTCGAALKTCGAAASKGCGYALPVTETKAVETAK